MGNGNRRKCCGRMDGVVYISYTINHKRPRSQTSLFVVVEITQLPYWLSPFVCLSHSYRLNNFMLNLLSFRLLEFIPRFFLYSIVAHMGCPYNPFLNVKRRKSDLWTYIRLRQIIFRPFGNHANHTDEHDLNVLLGVSKHWNLPMVDLSSMWQAVCVRTHLTI